MKDLYEFAAGSPILSFFVLWLVTAYGLGFAAWPFRLVNRWIRHRNIVAAGWPPPYLDADGDHKTPEEPRP